MRNLPRTFARLHEIERQVPHRALCDDETAP
jgi:hypothetical protein